MRRRSLLAAAVVGLVGGCGADDAEPTGRVRVATGATTAVYHAYGSAIAELIRERLPRVQPSVLATAASAENIQLVLGGGAEVGFTQADIAAAAAVEDSSRPRRLAALARLYDDYVHLVVRADSAIQRLADLRGRAVSLGAPGSGTSVTAERVLRVADPFGGAPPLTTLVVHRLGLDDSVVALRDGRVEAFFFSGGLPVTAIKRLSEVERLRLVDLAEYAAPLRRAYGDYYAARVVPGTTYGVPVVSSIGIPNYLVVRDDMDTGLSYALTKLLFDGREDLASAHPAGARLNIRSAISTPPVPLHPGSARYFREQKD